MGKHSYQMCVKDGHDPKEYADTIAGKNPLGMIVENLTIEFVSENMPQELPFFEQGKLGILKGFKDSARESGDMETSSYVSKLLRQLKAKSNQKQQ